MSDKLMEAAVLKLRSNILAAIAAIETIVDDPLSSHSGAPALEQIEKHAVTIGQSELAIKAIEKIRRLPKHPSLSDSMNVPSQSPAPRDPSTSVSDPRAKQQPRSDKTAEIKIRSDPPTNEVQQIIQNNPAILDGAEGELEEGDLLDKSKLSNSSVSAEQIEDYKKLLASRAAADRAPRRPPSSPPRKKKK